MTRFATPADYESIVKMYNSTKNYEKRLIDFKQVIVFEEDNELKGFLNFSYFWNHIPFMDLLFVHEKYRGKGIGTKLLKFWENEMKKTNDLVLTSTQANETAQHFYRKHGYTDCGGFVLPTEPLEIVLYKKL